MLLCITTNAAKCQMAGPTENIRADIEPDIQADNMKEHTMIVDNIMDNSDLDDEDRCLDPDHLEDRFRVDRRKLEHMIQADCDLEDVAAEEFFHKIMEDTNTRITWPSKLKIGAKSKKDPHIKVSGHKDAVADAKEKIMAVLDTKSSRVTLKMDVSHTEHSHVIGKGGNNIKKVMQDTGCHIHFPDSNRNTQAEKSNQVSIAGQPKGVEHARAKIRELLPLVFMFELPQPVAGLLQPLPDLSSPQIQQIQTTHGVTISFKQRMYFTTVIIRGSVCNAKSVKEATVVLIEHLTGNVGTSVPVSMQLEIAPQHHLFIIGRNGANIKQIHQQTGASIRFPDPNNSAPQRKGTVYISGAIESVFLARQHLIGCLPLVLMFDMKEETEIEQAKISQLMEQLDVYISIKPKPKQPSKSVIVKSIERNTANLYEARRRLLGLMSESPVVISSNHGDSTLCANQCLTSFSLLGPSLLNVNTTQQVFVMNGMRSPLSSPHGSHAVSPGLMSAPTVYHPMMVLQAPAAGLTPVAAASYQLYQQNGIAKEAALVNGFRKDLVQAATGANIHKRAAVMAASTDERSAPRRAPSPKMTTTQSALSKTTRKQSQSIQTQSQSNSPEIPRHVQIYSTPEPSSPSTIGSPSSDHHSNQSVSSVASSASSGPSSPPPPQSSACSLDLLSDALSMSFLDGSHCQPIGSINTSIGHLPFTKSDLQDAVSTIQNKPNLLHQLLPNEAQPSSEMAMDIFRHKSTDHDSLTSGLQHISPPGSVMNGAPTRRVKTPPGFSGPPLAHRENSPLRQFTPQYDSPLAYYESRTNTTSSPLSFSSSSGSSLGLSGSTLRRGRDSPLGCLGSPLAPGGSPLGTPLTAPASPICRNHSRLFQNGEMRSSESGCDSDGSDRAPGSHRPQKGQLPPPLFSPTSSFAAFDYEQKKLMATKAMQKKPEGESRIPTDFWSGLGFSKSMPDSAIRERLKANNVRYNGPSMTTTYECVNGEEAEMWDDGSQAVLPSVGDGLPSHISAAPGEFPSPRKKLSDYSSMCGGDNMETSMVSSIPHDWPPKTDLAELFSKLGLGKYTDLFTQQEIDLCTFLTLTDQDLRELGITTFGARRKMLLAIADLNKQPSLVNSTPGGNNNTNNPFRDSGATFMGSRRHDIASQSGRW